MTGVILRSLVVLISSALLLAACSSGSSRYAGRGDHHGSGAGGTYKVGNPYQVAGRWYHPAEDPNYNRTGIASWYGDKFHGKQTANGETYNMNELTAAHTTLPMPSFVRVTNLENGRSVVLRVNDRGPFVGDRIIDVSRRGAQLLGFQGQGLARVRVEAVPGPGGPATVQTVSAPKSTTRPTRQPDEVAISSAPIERVEQSSIDEPATLAGIDSTRWLDPDVTDGDRVFIQAGAFSVYDSARRVAETLEELGRVELSPLPRDNGYLYRVRIGPLASADEADTLLDRVLALGHNAARIVVD